MKWLILTILVAIVVSCETQRIAALPLSSNSFRQIVRGIIATPNGRYAINEDIIIRHYTNNSSAPTSRRIGDIKQFLKDPNFDIKKTTVLYAHGYVELRTDDSVMTMASAYLQHGGYNFLLLDWSNLAFGNYLIVAKSLISIGDHVGKALSRVIKKGLPLERLHLVGHSLGVHLMANVARYMKDNNGYKVPRISGLDPAYPAFYPPIAGPHITPSDADFVDIIHTDGGSYGAPSRTGHADFWPNGGQAAQPGCVPSIIPLTYEDFCSHWRSWEFWAESLNNEGLLARRCGDYDKFLRGQCQDMPIVSMGERATPNLRGNFYLRTGAKPPYGLGVNGAS